MIVFIEFRMSEPARYVLTLPNDNGQLSFSTRSELQSQLQQIYLDMYEALKNAGHGRHSFQEAVSNLFREWTHDSSLIQQHDFESIKKIVTKRFETWFTASSAKGKLVLSVYQHFGADASAGAFYVLANVEQSDLTTKHMIGVAAATNFLLGHPFGEVDARKHWEKLNNDAGTWLTQSREELEAARKRDLAERKHAHEEMLRLRNECQEAIEQAKQQANQLVAVTSMDVGRLIEAETARVNESVKITQEQLTDLKTKYNEELALQKPMEYWGKKETEHREGVKLWGWIFAIAAVVAGGAFFWFVSDQLPNDASLQHIPLNKIAQVAVLVTVGLWLLRMLARNYIMHLHLANDARERCVMVSTYLSMSSAGGINDEGRNLVMASIFRKASTGIVKEDAAPPTFIPMTRGGGD